MKSSMRMNSYADNNHIWGSPYCEGSESIMTCRALYWSPAESPHHTKYTEIFLMLQPTLADLLNALLVSGPIGILVSCRYIPSELTHERVKTFLQIHACLLAKQFNTYLPHSARQKLYLACSMKIRISFLFLWSMIVTLALSSVATLWKEVSPSMSHWSLIAVQETPWMQSLLVLPALCQMQTFHFW